MSKRNRMPGLRQKGGLWHIEKRCHYAQDGWLRESTGTSSRTEAERILIRRMAEVEEEARRHEAAIFTFEEAAFRYLKEIAHKSSADTIAMHLDQLFPFIGNLPIAHVHDGTYARSLSISKNTVYRQRPSTTRWVSYRRY